jgi:hypothetical protein
MRRAAVAGILAAGVLAGCGGGGGSPGGQAESVSPAAARAAAARAAAAFGVLRRPERPGDEIPPGQANGAVKPTLSRLVYAGPLGTLYAYVHEGLLCVSYSTRVAANGSGSASGGCDSVANAALVGVVAPIAASLDKLDRVALFLPDGARQVVMIGAGGSRTTVAVTENAVVYAAAGLRTWIYSTRDGVRHTGGLPVTGAVGAPATGQGAASEQVQPTVAPARGTPTTAFAVGLVARANLGAHQGLTTRYRIRLDGRTGGPLTPGCGAAAAPTVDQGRSGARLSLTLHPGTGGWCRGDYHGTVLLESARPCPAGKACPPANQSVAVGRFAFQVG